MKWNEKAVQVMVSFHRWDCVRRFSYNTFPLDYLLLYHYLTDRMVWFDLVCRIGQLIWLVSNFCITTTAEKAHKTHSILIGLVSIGFAFEFCGLREKNSMTVITATSDQIHQVSHEGRWMVGGMMAFAQWQRQQLCVPTYYTRSHISNFIMSKMRWKVWHGRQLLGVLLRLFMSFYAKTSDNHPVNRTFTCKQLETVIATSCL